MTDISMVEVAGEAANSGVLGSLGINGKLFLAQLVNFAIVLLVLWKWAYRPLIAMLDKRSKLIEESLNKTKEIDERMARIGAETGTLLKKAHQDAKMVMDETQAMAKGHRDAEMEKVRLEVERMIASGKDELSRLKVDLMRDAQKELGDLVALAAERVIAEKMTAKDHEQLIKRTVEVITGYGSQR